jgi:hypothetical protein
MIVGKQRHKAHLASGLTGLAGHAAVLGFALVCVMALAAPAGAQGFKFSNEDPAEKADKEAKAQRQAQVQSMLDTPCRAKIKNQKIMVMIGEERNGAVMANQAGYNTHISAINDRLTALGLRTFTQAQIRSQVAQAEIDAVFKNDADAAISASKRLAAQYILRGVISTSARRNAIVNVNQVNIGMAFTLTGANGRMISNTTAKNESYAGADVSGMAMTLINESAEEVVAQLYSDYCQKSGVK